MSKEKQKRILSKDLGIKIFIAIIIVALIGIPIFWVVVGDDHNKVSEVNNTYSATVGSNGQVTYVKTLEDGTTEPVEQQVIVEELGTVLRGYIGGDEEYYQETINYLMGAAAVTRLPYIESTDESEESGENVEETETEEGTEAEQEETPLVGQIKFYRYTTEDQANNPYTTDAEGNEVLKDEYRLTYVTSTEFDTLKNNYQNSGNTEVFKHFTMDEDGNVVIAYGSKETRRITSTLDAYDADLTLEMVKEASGVDKYTGNAKDGFSMVEYSIFTKPINYISLVEQYIMPTNLLYSLLIQTGDINFVKEIASLAYDNEIAVGIYDNESESTTTETYTYNKIMEIDGKTSLNFDNIQTTDPIIAKNDLYGGGYSLVPSYCSINTIYGKLSHRLYYFKPGEAPADEVKANDMYIGTTNNDGKITSLAIEENAKDFIVTYNKKINSTSVPTTGVILADTWIARWKATYTKEEGDPISRGDSDSLEDIKLIEYSTKNDVLDVFDATMKSDIETKLSDHAKKLKEAAIERIVEKTKFSVNATQITSSDLTETKKKEILKTHILSCDDCITAANAWWNKKNNNGGGGGGGHKDFVQIPLAGTGIIDESVKVASLSVNVAAKPLLKPTIDDIYKELNDELKDTIVKAHYETKIQSYVEEQNKKSEENAQKSEETKKATFKSELEAEGKITCTQTLTGEKQYVNITSTTSYLRTSSSYKKEPATEDDMDKEGEKFSSVYNDERFYKARDAIRLRQAWLWEYIRKNEDTAKLEDVISYLLYKATESDEYLTFDLDDLESIFKIFEPKEEEVFVTVAGGIGAYLAQIGGDKTKYEFDGISYYKMYTDAAPNEVGNPTIGPGDIKWSVHHGLFNMTGSVRYGSDGGTTYQDCNVQEEVNRILGGSNATWVGNPTEDKAIYIDAATVESVTDSLQSVYLDWVIEETQGISLSRQQIFALAAIKYATGNLSEVAVGETESVHKHFVDVYTEASQKHEVNSPEFNEYIWENWWSTKWQDGYRIARESYRGWLKVRDATFETYVKGTMFFEGGSVYGRTEFMYYSEENIRKIGFSDISAEMKAAKNRNINDEATEKETFTYVEATGTYQVINDADRYGIYTSTSGRVYTEWIQTTNENNSYGHLECLDGEEVIGSNGCNIYAYTMLLNSVGADVNPGIVHNEYVSFKTMNSVGTMENVMKKYHISGNVVRIEGSDKNKFISVLQSGRGITTWVGPGFDEKYTSKYHWLVVADIRASELGSDYGYDVYVLTSSKKGHGWQRIETIIDNIQDETFLGYYIQD